MKRNGTASKWLIAILLVTLTGCANAPKTENEKLDLNDEVQSALNRFKRDDPGLEDFLGNSVGYLMFPSIGKAGAFVGGAYGQGELFEGDELVGYADVSQASVGLQLGGQTYSELLVFDSSDALNRLKDKKLQFGANASAVALTDGASEAARFQNGVVVFTQARGGLMFEASVAGQRFTFTPSNR
jgi:lipid-binding SYLF domain-containing protein